MPVIFRNVLRFIALLITALALVPARSQTLANDSTAAIMISRAVSVPLNNLKLFDKALEAWTWTFGQEPGSQLIRSDRETGILEGTARVNFRSTFLNNREETMGTIQYKIIINVRSGECRTLITEFTHTGNLNAPRSGLHLGLLTRRIVPPVKTPGMGRNNAIRLYQELKDVSTLRANALLAAFEGRLRATTVE